MSILHDRLQHHRIIVHFLSNFRYRLCNR